MDHIAAKDAFRNLQESSRRHATGMALALENDTSQPRSPRAHHELDGFVHTSPHDAFARQGSRSSVPSASEDEHGDSEEGRGCLARDTSDAQSVSDSDEESVEASSSDLEEDLDERRP
uniref:Uncharacterized protein n=1 Tax=Pyrodinium bahamense TaxID=73915 RepID=A0A7S0FX95_9DINO